MAGNRTFLTNIDLNQNQLLNATIQNLAAAPGSPTTGQIYYDTTLSQMGYYNGSWQYFPMAAATVVSNDANNSIVTGSDGGAYFLQTVTTIATGSSPTGAIVYTDESGNVTTLNLLPFIQAGETTTSIAAGTTATGAIQYTDEDGGVTNLNLSGVIADGETTTSITFNTGTTVLSYTDEDGGITNMDLSSLTTDIYVTGAAWNPGTMQLTLSDNTGSTADIVVDLSTLQSVITPTLTSGLWSHNDGNGTIQNIRSISQDANNALSAGTDGGAFINAGSLGGWTITDGTTSQVITGGDTLTVTPSGQIVAEVSATDTLTIGFQETVSTLVDNTTGTYTYTNETGGQTVISTMRKYTETFTTVASTPFTITHNLGTQDVMVQLRDNATNEHVEACVDNATANTVEVTTNSAETLRAVIIG